MNIFLQTFPNGGHILSWISLIGTMLIFGSYYGLNKALVVGSLIVATHEFLFFTGALYFYHYASFFLLFYVGVLGLAVIWLKELWYWKAVLISAMIFIVWFGLGFPITDPLTGNLGLEQSMIAGGFEVASWFFFCSSFLLFGLRNRNAKQISTY